MCGYAGNCIPQNVRPLRKLDALSDRLMYRLQYRQFADHASMVVNHTVDVDGTDHAGVRWYELRNTGGGWTINQQGTYAPDSSHRWMGSIAMDSAGNIALGYSVSSATSFPSIRYTGRLAGDPAGTLPQGETTLIAGGGGQTQDPQLGSLGRLQLDVGGSVGRLHVLVHAAILRGDQQRGLADAHRLLQICLVRVPAGHRRGPPDGEQDRNAEHRRCRQ